MEKKRILIIDDEAGICTSLSYALKGEYDVTAVCSPAEGLKLIAERTFHICLLDLKIGQYDGIEVLHNIKELQKSLAVIMITAFGSIDTVVEAVKMGAYTYLTKPLDMSNLHITIKQALDYQCLHAKVEYLSQELESRYFRNGMIGRSDPMLRVFEVIEKLKDIDTNVVITGESGTGKELAARAIHFSGKRRDQRFVVVNSAAIPEGLLEEELFGHKRGSFTGAVSDTTGKFKYANYGTIFLDEIGDMPLNLQAKLLRVLQEKEFTPIGGNEPQELDVRVIAATNKDLREMVDNGLFREDLYFRLNVVEILMPSLRDKKQDLPLLFKHFIQKYAAEMGKKITGFSAEAEQLLLNYNYPGNVRELCNIIEYAIVMSNTDVISADVLPYKVRNFEPSPLRRDKLFAEDLIGLTMKEIEERVIRASLIYNGGHVRTTAEMLKLSDKGLRNKIAAYDIKIS